MDENFYEHLSDYYDLMQVDIDTAMWASFIDDIVKKHCTCKGDGQDGKLLLCDLGCGQGRVTIEFAKLGYDVIGIDSATTMLEVAREKSMEANLEQSILWLNQDITDYELFGTCDVFCCLLDTINHITEESDIAKILHSFKNYMNHGGVFIFDIASKAHFEKTLANNVFFEDYDEFTLLWDNKYDSEERMNYANITLFERDKAEEEDEEDVYFRTDGVIRERFYELDAIRQLAEEAGLEIADVLEMPGDTERIFIVLKKR